MSEKTCTVCGVTKPLADYSPCRNGYQPSCKMCRNYKAACHSISVTVSEQECRACGQLKIASEFNRSKHRRSGLQGECKACTNARKASVAYEVTVTSKVCCDCGQEKRADEFPRDKKRVGGLRKQCRGCISIRNRATVYSISLEETKEMCSATACEICGGSFRTARDRNIDHCHATGAVRGVLCNLCNRMLGSAKDNPETLEAAAAYLRLTSQGAVYG